jgi:hypothetical protein
MHRPLCLALSGLILLIHQGYGLAQTELSPSPEAQASPLPEPGEQPFPDLPEQIQIQGRSYTQQPDDVPDIGRFVTDGTRANGLVIFWEISPREISLRQRPPLPDPLPENLYLLNSERKFVRYSS